MSFFTKHTISKPNCNKCGMYKAGCISPKMQYTGNGEKGILIISDYPSEDEDISGIHFSGASGGILKKALGMYGILLERDCWVVQSVNCRPLKSGELQDPEKYIKFCRPYLEATIKALKPSKILVLGDTAIKSFWSNADENLSIVKTQGIKFWDSSYNAWVFSTWNPSDLLKFSKDRSMAMLFNKTIKKCVQQEEAPMQTKFVTCRKIIVFEDVITYLTNILNKETLIVIDYETTGSNVALKGHKTASVSIATPKEAVSFLYEHPYYTNEQQSQISILLKKVLKKSKIKKIVHNLQYEHVWSKYVVGQVMNNIHFDTMLGAHLVDNRQGICSLKYQAFQRWGVPDYSKGIKQFLTPDSSGFNKVFSIPIDKLLEYGAKDVMYTLALYEAQMEELCAKEKEAYKLFHEAAIIFSEMGVNGIKISPEFYEKERVRLVAERDSLIHSINNSEEIKRFNRKFGNVFNMDSPIDVQNLLFDIMGLTAKKQTGRGSDSVDAEVLSKIDHPVTSAILKIRKLSKVIGTYIDGFKNAATDGYLHPSFLLHVARSYRSSAVQPNFQNLPKRDKQANKAVRSGIVPEEGCVICETDFSGAEIVTSIAWHRDPTFINYQLSDTADMHRDAAENIWKAQGLISKPVRQATKGGFTFAEFYGSYYVSCATKMWEECLDLELTNGVKLREHTKKVGLNTYKEFENNVKEFEHKFWYEWFPVYTQWKKDIYESYLKNGYIETFFGFRFKGYMDRKQAANYPIQGCLRKGSLVQTKGGWVPIEDLVDKVVQVWTGFKWAHAVGVNRGPCRTAKIRLFSGMEINCDTRHYLKDTEHKWVPFSELRVGGHAVLPLVEETCRVPAPTEIDVWFLLGFIIGDGCFTGFGKTPNNRRVTLTIHGGESKVDILYGMCDWIRENLPVEKGSTLPKVVWKSATKCLLHMEGRKIEEWLCAYGMGINKKAHTKRIPKAVWTATKEQQASFMEGLWLSDGSRGCNDYRSLHMRNYTLLKEVQILTYGIGYDSKIRRTTSGFKLSFHNMYPKGQYSTRKMPRSVVDRLCAGKGVCTVNGGNTSITDRRNQLSGKDIVQPVAERIVRRLVGEVEMYRYDVIEDIRVSRYVEDTYTMAVDDDLHQFVADGVIHKNTSFHILLYALIKLYKKLKELNMKTKLVGQIHDSIIAQVPTCEIEQYKKVASTIINNLKNELGWLCIPMRAEMEASKIISEGGSFAEMTRIL